MALSGWGGFMVGGVGFECCILLGFGMRLVVAVSGFSGCVVFGGPASCGFCLLQLLLVFLVVC